MDFFVGYQIREDNKFNETVLKNRDKISEIYFSWDDIPNGRSTLNMTSSYSKWELFEKQKRDFCELDSHGFAFNLLLNGNCYGADSQSRSFFCKIGDSVDYLSEKYNLKCVTTASPLIAKFIKQNFSRIEVRASVNMEIGNSQAMDYVEDLFDSFYLKREYNRDFRKIKSAADWCHQRGKKLYGLANSGCLNFCSVHTFHDNLVSHEEEISKRDNAYQFEGQCWDYLKKEDKKNRWLRITNFIRPEDVRLYEGLFDGMKLATRVNKKFAKIVDSYAASSFNGNLPELLEPDHSGAFYPIVIDNKSITQDFGEKVLFCNKKCDECSYCIESQKNASLSLE